MKSDDELLRRFIAGGDDEAFTALVRRHVDLVHSAALRQVGHDAHLAHDVAQLVFIALARKAGTLMGRPSLAGWLYTSTHHAAANLVRAERRRRTHEQESPMMPESPSESSAATDWDRLRPVLDAAMLELREDEREIVVQRFFTGRSFADIGATVQLNEDTARKRAARALDKLHAVLGRRGIRSTSSALALALSTHGISAAPSGLAASLSAGALSAAALPAASAAAAPILAMSKLTVIVASAAVVLLGGAWVYQQKQLSVARAEVAVLRESRHELVAKIAALRQRTSERPARTVSSTSGQAGMDALQPSEMTLGWGSAAKIRAGLDASYAPLFRRLQLAPRQVEALKELLVRRRRATFLVHDLLAAEQMTMADVSPRERAELEQLATQPIDEEIKAFLSPADFACFASFERTLPLRSLFTATQLSSSAEPLRDDQIDRLSSWLEAEFPSPERLHEHGVIKLWQHVMRAAPAILSPAQLEKFAAHERAMNSWRRIIEINRSAEAKGLIKGASYSTAP
jgi:RNA polymerase sigma factor (sigma-70 family)